MVSLRKVMFAEGFGTFLLVLFGCGSVHTAVLFGAHVGLWQVAIVWGLGIILAPIAGAIAGGGLYQFASRPTTVSIQGQP